MWLWTKSQIACTRAQPSGCLTEQLPSDVGQVIGLAIAAAEQENQHVRRQILHKC
jgi:hypothetical protein